MNLSAVLLAGGESRRMGSDKATLSIRGKPLWQIQLDCLRKLQPAELFVSARSDPAWRPGDVHFVADAPPSRGPLSGLSATLAQIRTTHLLALGIDMPFMSDKYLRSLCDRIDPGRGVVPMIGKCAEPLAAIYPAGAHVDLAQALQGSDVSLRSLIRRLTEAGKLRVVPVRAAEENFFRNINRAADLA